MNTLFKLSLASLVLLMAHPMVGMKQDPYAGSLEQQLFTSIKNNDIDKARILLAAGANSNTRDEYDQSLLLHASFRDKHEICKLLLDAGANLTWGKDDYFDSYPLIWAAKSKMIKTCNSLIANSIFKPAKHTIARSVKTINTTLGCLKRKGMPRDLRCLICSYLQGPDMGILMISRKLNGKPIPQIYENKTAAILYVCTLAQLKEKMRYIKDTEEMWNNIEAQFGQQIKENIRTRLAQPKLLCNGTVTAKIKFENDNNKCSIM